MNDSASTDGATSTGQPEQTETVGRVGAPGDHEATSQEFFFWAREESSIEKTQLVRVDSQLNSEITASTASSPRSTAAHDCAACSKRRTD